MSRGFSANLPVMGLDAGLDGNRVGFGFNTQTRELKFNGLMGNGYLGSGLGKNWGSGFHPNPK